MALIQFEIPYPVSWSGKTYLAGLQSIPEELATALGWSAATEEPESPTKNKRPRVLQS